VCPATSNEHASNVYARGQREVCLPSTDSENSHERIFRPFSKLQSFDDWHRQYDDCEIGQDVDCRVGIPHGELIDALCGFFGPESTYRNAGEDTAADCPDRVATDYCQQGPAGDLKLFGMKYSLILQDDRGFRESEGEIVAHQRCPESLLCLSRSP
jgi:hypothetical protein